MRDDTDCAIYETDDGRLYAVVREPTGKGIGKYDRIVYAVPDAEGAGYRMLSEFSVDPCINDDWETTDAVSAEELDDDAERIGCILHAGELLIAPYSMGCAGRKAFGIRYDD